MAVTLDRWSPPRRRNKPYSIETPHGHRRAVRDQRRVVARRHSAIAPNVSMLRVAGRMPGAKCTSWVDEAADAAGDPRTRTPRQRAHRVGKPSGFQQSGSVGSAPRQTWRRDRAAVSGERRAGRFGPRDARERRRGRPGQRRVPTSDDDAGDRDDDQASIRHPSEHDSVERPSATPAGDRPSERRAAPNVGQRVLQPCWAPQSRTAGQHRRRPSTTASASTAVLCRSARVEEMHDVLAGAASAPLERAMGRSCRMRLAGVGGGGVAVLLVTHASVRTQETGRSARRVGPGGEVAASR